MKYNTFRNTVLSVGALAALGSASYVLTRRPADVAPPPLPPARIVEVADPPPQAVVPPPPDPVAPVAAAGTLRDVDVVTLALLKGPARDKVKDATPGKPYKVNLYSDDGKRFNRAKVDLNRNEKWDEKWSLDDAGELERQVAPADDENYREKYVFRGGAWVRR